MTTLLAAPTGSTRVVAVGDIREIARGRAAEFRHLGLTLAGRPTAMSALVEVSREPDSVVLVSTRMDDMPLVDFVDVVRSLAHSRVLLGIAAGCQPAVVSELFDHGVTGSIPLPVTPSRLAHAIAATLRPERAESPPLRWGDLELDVTRHRVLWGGSEVRLGPKEFEVLRCVMEAHPRVLHLTELAPLLDDGASEQSVRVAAARVRAKCSRVRPDLPPVLETVHRVGYRLSV